MTTPNYQCPSCIHGYLGYSPSKAWYAGDGTNPNLCYVLDNLSDASRVKNKVLRHWRQGDFDCPRFALAKGVRADGKAIMTKEVKEDV
jgi:hypothetical protein